MCLLQYQLEEVQLALDLGAPAGGKLLCVHACVLAGADDPGVN